MHIMLMHMPLQITDTDLMELIRANVKLTIPYAAAFLKRMTGILCKIPSSPAIYNIYTFVLRKNLVKKFRLCGKSHHILCAIFNAGQKR